MASLVFLWHGMAFQWRAASCGRALCGLTLSGVSLARCGVLDRARAARRAGAGVVIVGGALLVAWLLTLLAVAALRRALPAGAAPSRHDFVGLTCVIRTGHVSRGFGQAEAHSPDGSSAVVQVRQAGSDPLTYGAQALLYDFDVAGEFFRVVPADVALRPDPPVV
jgi:hypothetical protein